MKRAATLATLCLITAACATPESMERHRETCASYGHTEGTPEMAACVERKSHEGEAAAGRIGTSVFTKVLIGAL